MIEITLDDYQMMQHLSEALIDHTEGYPNEHPLVKVLIAMQEPLHAFEKDLKPKTYHCEPYIRALDDPREQLTVCPGCGCTSDFCQDHKHWYCDVCEAPLEITHNTNDEPIWACEYCDTCQFCGSPNIEYLDAAKIEYRCEDCPKGEDYA